MDALSGSLPLGPFQSAFRKEYECQTMPLKAVGVWERALHEKKTCFGYSRRLVQGFWLSPSYFTVGKAYGLGDDALDQLQSYLNDKKKCVKIGVVTSSWKSILKDMPEDSILGPLLFNIFISDIFWLSRKYAFFLLMIIHSLQLRTRLTTWKDYWQKRPQLQ
mgnify:CR=1 FL=1